MSLLEEAFNKKCNVIYLLDDITNVRMMKDVDIYQIKMFLHNQFGGNLYMNRSIPIFSEDDEARLFIECLFDYYQMKYCDDFQKIKPLFHFVKANVSAEALLAIFRDDKLLTSTMRSICIVDGDKNIDIQQKSFKKQKAEEIIRDADFTNYILKLPGNMSPEELAFQYSIELFENDAVFWQDKTLNDIGFTKISYRDNIRPHIDSINEKIKELQNSDESTNGVRRKMNKKLFNNNQYKKLFKAVLEQWIRDNEEEVNKFYKNLHVLFCKVSDFHDINPGEWKLE